MESIFIRRKVSESKKSQEIYKVKKSVFKVHYVQKVREVHEVSEDQDVGKVLDIWVVPEVLCIGIVGL